MSSYKVVELEFPPGAEYAYASRINKWGAIAGQVTMTRSRARWRGPPTN